MERGSAQRHREGTIRADRSLVIVSRIVLAVLLVAVLGGMLAACSDDGQPVAEPAFVPVYVSEICSPVDTLECRGFEIYRYEYREVRITSDMLIDEVDEILGLVEANLFADETLTLITPPGIPGCVRLGYATSGDVVAQTSRETGTGDEYRWGRFFSFSRIDGGLVLLEVGFWEWPEEQQAPVDILQPQQTLGWLGRNDAGE